MIRSAIKGFKAQGPPPDPTSVNYTREHVSLSRTIARRKRVIRALEKKLPLIRGALIGVALLWLLALPYDGLWKHTYVDEHAIQPAQVTMYFDWSNVHQADRYLEHLEALISRNATTHERSTYLQHALATSGLSTGNTSLSTWGHVAPPRSAGTEAILLSANWVSRDGDWNLRGVAMLLALGEFLRGQNHWAFDFILIFGEDYLSGLEEFMRDHQQELFSSAIWTGVNIDYPGHSFSHLGMFYEGVNGRLPNQDLLNTAAHISRYAGGVSPRIHDIDNDPYWTYPAFLHKPWTLFTQIREPQQHPGERREYPRFVKDYILAVRGLWEHARYNALGRASGGHGVLARHRIDAITLYCHPSSGPHGFHTLGRTLESTLRSLNNLQERLHASYFFYLMPKLDFFIPVGSYLPIAILLGASVTLGGFNCPSPLEGLLWGVLPALALSALGWWVQSVWVSVLVLVLPRFSTKGFGVDTGAGAGASFGGMFGQSMRNKGRHAGTEGGSIEHKEQERRMEQITRSILSLTHLFYGALIPTLAMVNFPQAIMLALGVIVYLGVGVGSGWEKWALLGLHPGLFPTSALQVEWQELGNLAWPGVFGIWLPLWIIVARL